MGGGGNRIIIDMSDGVVGTATAMLEGGAAAAISSAKHFIAAELPEVLELAAASLKRFPLPPRSMADWNRSDGRPHDPSRARGRMC